jgi:hypothetical protein
MASALTGKSGYIVELEFNGIKIYRKNSPRTIKVTTPEGEELEMSSAQDYINNYFGTEHVFGISSYIQQGGAKSFVLMTPSDKLEFLEKFALSSVDLGAIRGRCTAKIKKSDSELRDATAKLSAVKEHFSELKKLDKSPYSTKEYEKEKTELKNDIETIQSAFDRCTNTLSILYNEKAERKTLQVGLDEKEKSLQQDRDEMKKLQEECESIDYCGNEELEKLQKELSERLEYKEILQKKKELEENQERLKIMEETERKDREQELAGKRETLWVEYSEADTINSIEYYKKLEKDLQTLERLTTSIAKFNIDEKELMMRRIELKKCKEILKKKTELYEKLKKQDKTYSCPECKTIVRIQDDILVRYDGDGILDKGDLKTVKKDISLLETKISENDRFIHDTESKLIRLQELEEERKTLLEGYEDDITEMTHTEVRGKLDYFANYKREQKDLEDKIKWLEGCLQKNNFSKPIENFRNEIRALENFVKKKSPSSLKSAQKNKLSEEKLQEKIQHSKNYQ